MDSGCGWKAGALRPQIGKYMDLAARIQTRQIERLTGQPNIGCQTRFKFNRQQTANHGLAIVSQQWPSKGNAIRYRSEVNFVFRSNAQPQVGSVRFIKQVEYINHGVFFVSLIE
jgi:hypothetical protein